MHDIAEYGVAAHALYKDAVGANGQTGGQNGGQAGAKIAGSLQKDGGPYVWLRRLVETLLEGSNPEEFLEHTKLELFQDQVFCFSPKGRLIALPRGATPLDFAYAVHTDVGNAAVGAFVNGRHVPIDTQLRNGDEVEIETAKNHVPPAAWENLVVTGRARSAIRRAARDAVRKQYRELGRRLLAARFEQIGAELNDDVLKKALPRLGRKSLEDMLRRRRPQRGRHRGRGARCRARCRRDYPAQEAVLQADTPLRPRARPGRLVQHRPRHELKVPDRPGSARHRGACHPRGQGRPAGDLRAGWRRAWRPHRRRADPQRRDPHLPDPFPACASSSTRAGSMLPGI